MSEVRLVVREASRDWSGTIHGGSADCAIAALSADPVTLSELEAACSRFQKPSPNCRFFAGFSAGLHNEPHDAGIVIIDLVARLVAVDSTYSSPGRNGEICYHNGHCSTDTWLRYHLADDWLFADYWQWPGLAEVRRREHAARPQFDARAVFYERPLLEFVARESFAVFARRKTTASTVGDTIREIHAAWLLTRRDDLGGVCPRDVAVERHDHLTWDLQDQCDRWSRLGKCPPGLDESSFAFRYGGFGTHELVKYYDLVRELIWSCWNRLEELKKTHFVTSGPESLTVSDFLTSEIPCLENVRDNWLNTPDSECLGRTPQSIIDRERARLPEAMSGHDAIIDSDCPCCQMLSDMPGPMFWHFDGCNMDDDFAFDMSHRTREEWEAEQRKWEEHRKRHEAEWAERKRLGVTDSSFGGEGKDSIWSTSFTVGDTLDVPLGVRLFGIGGHLAELIVDIRGESATHDAQRLIDQLNRDFGNLRELLQTSELSLVEALIDPVIDRFAATMADVVTARPDLRPKCESLTGKLRRLLDETSGDFLDGDDDSDLPF